MLMSESHCNIDLHLLRNLKYEDHHWIICGDVEVIALVLGLQGGYTKFPYVFMGQQGRQQTNVSVIDHIKLESPCC